MHGPDGGAKDLSGEVDLLKIKGRALPLAPEVGGNAPKLWGITPHAGAMSMPLKSSTR
jgi:hypothetical protein